jgi:hypothetical protein
MTARSSTADTGAGLFERGAVLCCEALSVDLKFGSEGYPWMIAPSMKNNGARISGLRSLRI